MVPITAGVNRRSRDSGRWTGSAAAICDNVNGKER